jgi:hypothetical protein
VPPSGKPEQVWQQVGCEIFVQVEALLLNPGVQLFPQLNVSQNTWFVANPDGQAPHTLTLPHDGGVVHVDSLVLKPGVQLFPQLNVSQDKRVGKLPNGHAPHVVNVDADVISSSCSPPAVAVGSLFVGDVPQPIRIATSTPLHVSARRRTDLELDMSILSFENCDSDLSPKWKLEFDKRTPLRVPEKVLRYNPGVRQSACCCVLRRSLPIEWSRANKYYDIEYPFWR